LRNNFCTTGYHRSLILAIRFVALLLPDLAAPVSLGSSGAVVTGCGHMQGTGAATPQSVGPQAQTPGNTSTNAGEILNLCYHLEIENHKLEICLCALFSILHTCGSLQFYVCIYYYHNVATCYTCLFCVHKNAIVWTVVYCIKLCIILCTCSYMYLFPRFLWFTMEIM
jgi:hypothetical protein